MAMLAKLIDDFEDYFIFPDNLLVSLSLNDVSKVFKIYKKLNSNIPKLRENTIRCRMILEVKLHFVPLIEDILIKLSKIYSDSQILQALSKSDVKKLKSFYNINQYLVNILEFLAEIRHNAVPLKFNLYHVLSKCRFYNIILPLIIRCFELADYEVSRSFKLYKNISNLSHERSELFGGVVYFLFIVCFESFTPGLKEFLRISIKELEKLIQIDPSLSYWNPELSILRSIMELYNHSDLNSSDNLLYFLNFEFKDLKSEFKNILEYSFDVINMDERTLALNLIKKFGNQNIEPLFLRAFQMLQDVTESDSNTVNIGNGVTNSNYDNNLKDWIPDFLLHLQKHHKTQIC